MCTRLNYKQSKAQNKDGLGIINSDITNKQRINFPQHVRVMEKVWRFNTFFAFPFHWVEIICEFITPSTFFLVHMICVRGFVFFCMENSNWKHKQWEQSVKWTVNSWTFDKITAIFWYSNGKVINRNTSFRNIMLKSEILAGSKIVGTLYMRLSGKLITEWAH